MSDNRGSAGLEFMILVGVQRIHNPIITSDIKKKNIYITYFEKLF
jgi:hypothetical protein